MLPRIFSLFDVTSTCSGRGQSTIARTANKTGGASNMNVSSVLLPEFGTSKTCDVILSSPPGCPTQVTIPDRGHFPSIVLRRMDASGSRADLLVHERRSY